MLPLLPPRYACRPRRPPQTSGSARSACCKSLSCKVDLPPCRPRRPLLCPLRARRSLRAGGDRPLRGGAPRSSDRHGGQDRGLRGLRGLQLCARTGKSAPTPEKREVCRGLRGLRGIVAAQPHTPREAHSSLGVPGAGPGARRRGRSRRWRRVDSSTAVGARQVTGPGGGATALPPGSGRWACGWRPRGTHGRGGSSCPRPGMPCPGTRRTGWRRRSPSPGATWDGRPCR